MPEQDYRDPIIEKYLDLLKDNLGSKIRKYFNGIPSIIAQSECPAIAIGIERTEMKPYTTEEDEHRISLVLVLITDIRESLSNNYRMDQGISQVLDIFMGRNSDYTLKSNSIAKIIRDNRNIDLTNHLKTDVGSISIITPKDVVQDRINGYWTAEGTMRFQAHYYQSY